MKKAAFFDPYLDTLGGGDRYFLTLASFLADKEWEVNVFGFGKEIAKKAEERFGIDFKRVNFVNTNLSTLSLLKKRKLLSKYDLSFWISDGSVPFLFAKKNILHFQVPFTDVGGKSLTNKLKLGKIDHVVCNSFFTKRFIDREYGVESRVVYPPVFVGGFKSGKKENIILSVARFTDLLHNKRQDVLIEAFGKLTKGKKGVLTRLLGWKFILAGSDKEGKKLVQKLKEMSGGCNIEIKTNISFAELKKLYSRAKIFWTATGFGSNEEKHPEVCEHFGMTTVEAMAAGCVPVVIGRGGQKEIIEHGKNGFCWQDEQELIKLTKGLVEDKRNWKKLSGAAHRASQQFSEKVFEAAYEKIIG